MINSNGKNRQAVPLMIMIGIGMGWLVFARITQANPVSPVMTPTLESLLQFEKRAIQENLEDPTLRDPAKKDLEERLEQVDMETTRIAGLLTVSPAPLFTDTDGMGTNGVYTLLGIIEDPTINPRDIYYVENAWQRSVNGEYLRVYVGCLKEDQTQGILYYETFTTGRTVLLTAQKSGFLRIVAEKEGLEPGITLVIQTESGEMLYFNVLSKEFTRSPDEILPTSTAEQMIEMPAPNPDARP